MAIGAALVFVNRIMSSESWIEGNENTKNSNIQSTKNMYISDIGI